MEVTAKEKGFYGGSIKEVGETFNITKPEHLGQQDVGGNDQGGDGDDTDDTGGNGLPDA